MSRYANKFTKQLENKINDNKGITLIALVITIVVLIILATISINIIIKDDGIIKRVESAEEIQKMAEEKERLELIKTAVAIDNKGKVPLDKYIEELIKEGIATEDEVTENEDGSKQVITDNGYSVNIKQDGEYNVIITVEGKEGSLPVRIVNVQLTTSTNSIKVDVEVRRGEGAKYKYYYKTEDTEYKLAHEGKETSYTIGNLEQNVTYTIKVEAINENGTVYKEAVGRTGEVQSAVGVIEFGSLEWNNGQAEVTITKNTSDDLKIQYQVLDEELNVVKEYQEIASGEKITGLNLGETVQARLWDGTNYGSTASLTVTDTTAPNTATITLSSTTTTTTDSITATVTQSDSQSGVDITSCKWVYSETSDSIGTDASSYPNTFSTTPQTLTLQQTTEGTYYLHVLTIDKVGNKSETISEAITVEEIKAGTVVTKPETWTSLQVKAIADGNGGTIPLPNGFYYIGGDIKTGLVISDKVGDTMDASGTKSGNQFVWIPVSSNDDLTRTLFSSSTGKPTTGLSTSYTEPYATGCDTEKSKYNTMKTQVLMYNGFYMGRYEAGINSTTLRTTYSTAQTVVSKKGVAPYNYVPWSGAMTTVAQETGKSGAVYLAYSMYSTSNSVESYLCFGSQWDAMCRYIGDSQRKPTTKSEVELTGSVSTDVSKNIYDLAGNCQEWTMEAYGSDYRTLRGGNKSETFSISTRRYGYPTIDYYIIDRIGFRCTIWIK